MTDRAVFIIAGDTRWHIGRVDGSSVHVEAIELPEDASAPQIAEAVAAQLSGAVKFNTSQESDIEHQTPLKPIPGAGVLGVPSGWCLCGSVSVPTLAPRQRRTAMLFALEEKLPISAEEIVADFVVNGDHALGVAVEVRRLRELVDALEDRGIAVDTICPTALLALQHLYKEIEANEACLAWRDPEGLNLFELDADGRPEHWRWLPYARDEARRAGGAAGLSPPEKDWLAQHLQADQQPQLIDDPELLKAASLMAVDIQAGRTEPWVNLRRDALDVSDRMRRVRVHIMAVMAAAVVLLLAVTGVCFWRAHQYRQAEQRYESALTALYHDTFGDQPQPTSVKRRFDTRLRELRGLRGEEVEDTSDLATNSALWLLYDMLERLPTDKRYCLLDITAEQDRLTIAGQARTHSDADLIASALRRGGRFEVEPPSTSNLKDGGVSFRLDCIVIDKKPATPTKPSTITEIAGATAQGRIEGRLAP